MFIYKQLHTILSSYSVFIRNKTIMKYLNVAEKNDAAKGISGHLSRGTSRRREGLSPYNKIYEFEADVLGQRSTMIMTSVSGHLLGYEFVGAYRKWQSCNPLTLFEAPVMKDCGENYQKIKKTLEREVRGCNGLIIWTDCDREGENIGFEIIEVCKAVKSSLKVFRAKFSEITAVSVSRALQNLEAPNKNISDAVDVRQELDLRIGAAFTRFQTLRLQQIFPSKLADSLVSYGSCQFPTLGFVVERYRAVENFVPEQFWKIRVTHKVNNLSVEFLWERVRLFHEQACRAIHNLCMQNPSATVCDIKTKPKSKWRPLPLDTVELEKNASRKLKINAKETMKIAEKLYTQGFISYPRTETNQYPKEMNLGELVGLHTSDSRWGQFAQTILDSGGPTPRQGSKSDQAHPPIHPTKHTTNLSGNELRVYEFIVRSFLACCSKDAEGQETTVKIDITGEKFSANGLMITARNYLDVYPYDKWSSKEIHVYENGQSFDPTELNVAEGQTSAPQLLTEADLIALMEKHGIGTDATHADHIETIKSRSYVALSDQVHFVPGVLGMGLVEGYDAMNLPVAKPHLRAQLEADLKEICEGRKEPSQVLAEQISIYREVYLTVTAEAIKIDQALSQRFNEPPNEHVATVPVLPDAQPVLKCPKCQSDMSLRKKKNNDGYYIGCMSYPQCKNAVWMPSLVNTVTVLDETCRQCGPNYHKLLFHWRGSSISHLYPPPYTGCIGGCDTGFLEILNINQASVMQSSNNARNNSTLLTAPNVTATRTNDTARRGITNNYSTNIPNREPRTEINIYNNQNNLNSTRNSGWNLSSSVSNPQTSTNFTDNGNRRNDNDDDNVITCSCKNAAILLTVRKETPNFGRKFYKCATREGGCDFFLWASEEGQGHSEGIQNGQNASFQNASGQTNTNFFNSRVTSSATNSNDVGGSFNRGNNNQSDSGFGSWNLTNDDEMPMCNCAQLSRKITVSKDGPNKGREFYGCTKSMSDRCNFFQWADSTPSGGNSNFASASRGRGRGRGSAPRGRDDNAGAKRKCSNCKQPGHTKNKCPLNG